MSADYDKPTVAMIWDYYFWHPGIFLMNKVSRGIKIAITFVILSYVFGVLQ